MILCVHIVIKFEIQTWEDRTIDNRNGECIPRCGGSLRLSKENHVCATYDTENMKIAREFRTIICKLGAVHVIRSSTY